MAMVQTNGDIAGGSSTNSKNLSMPPRFEIGFPAKTALV